MTEKMNTRLGDLKARQQKGESLKQHTNSPPQQGIGNKPSERWRKEHGRTANRQIEGRQ